MIAALDLSEKIGFYVDMQSSLHAAENERRIIELLGRWVSELEPEIAYNRQFEVIGLSYAGEIVIEVEGAVIFTSQERTDYRVRYEP